MTTDEKIIKTKVKPIWINGCGSIFMRRHTPANIASDEHRFSSKHNLSPEFDLLSFHCL
jgi:hypothetical protein